MNWRITASCVFSTLILSTWVALIPGKAQAAKPHLAQRCVEIRNDDTIRPYDPALRARLISAFSRLFPGARMPPSDAELRGANLRCMDGHLLACFIGANLPCAKMNTARDNRGADEYCRDNPAAAVVPAFATGHDTIYAYRCASGHPVISGQTFTLDGRGFAARLWAPLE